jgi:hypothetical protein
MDNNINVWMRNPRVTNTQRTFNEKTLALKEMIKISRKHFPHLYPIILKEYNDEMDVLRKDNQRRYRMSIIGK